MVIQGLQKLTLLDYPDKVACTVFTAGCNFRCPFCHNASLVVDTYKNKEIPEEDFFSYLNVEFSYVFNMSIIHDSFYFFFCKI